MEKQTNKKLIPGYIQLSMFVYWLTSVFYKQAPCFNPAHNTG